MNNQVSNTGSVKLLGFFFSNYKLINILEQFFLDMQISLKKVNNLTNMKRCILELLFTYQNNNVN
jgi:hypothetical protein